MENDASNDYFLSVHARSEAAHSFTAFPVEILGLIFSFLDVESVVSLTQVSRGVKKTVAQGNLDYCQKLILTFFPRFALPTSLLTNEDETLFLRRILELKSICRLSAASGIGHTLCCTPSGLFGFGNGEFGALGFGFLVDIQLLPRPLPTDKFLLHPTREKVVQVSCGAFHSAFVSSLGIVYTCGEAESNRLGYDVEEDENVTLPRPIPFTVKTFIAEVSLGSNYGILRSKDGFVYSFGKSGAALGLGKVEQGSEPRKITSLTEPLIKVACGEMHSLFVGSSGAVYACGVGKQGRLGLGNDETQWTPKKIERLPANTRIFHASAGSNFSLIISDSGILFSFGDGKHGKLGHGELDSQLINLFSPTPVAYFIEKRIKIIDCVAGTSHSLAITAAGNLFSFGKNSLNVHKYLGLNTYGILGLGDEESRGIPTRVEVPNERVCFAEAGDWNSLIGTEMGNLYTFGGGWFGRLGHATTANQLRPCKVEHLRWQQ